MKPEIKLSVRTLVEYVYSSGSIDNRFRTATTMMEGTKAHKAIQSTYQEKDQKEVYLRTEVECEQVVFVIEGRCDGVLIRNNEIMIDEIKSTSRELREIDENSYPVHWAQAKVYAYIFAKDHKLQEMNVQLTYMQIASQEQKKFQKKYPFETLKNFVKQLVESYLPFAQLLYEHQKSREQSISDLQFPFETYRQGQRKLAGAVYKTITEGKTLFANAPTGIGKTISTIFPAVKAVGEGKLERIFYLTAKTITRQSAEDAFSLLKDNGLIFCTVTITAKEKVCFKEETICQKEYCEFANGYYDRINKAILDIFSHETFINRETIEEYARKHTLCPFEFSLDIASIADAIICDYNYIFDPKVSLKRFFEEQKKQSVLLIDEAHNLVDRAREMFSANLAKSNFLKVKQSTTKGTPLYKAAANINKFFIEIRKSHLENQGYKVEKEVPKHLIELLEIFISEAEIELLQFSMADETPLLLDTYFVATDFIRISKLYDERYITLVEFAKNEVNLKLLCLDPSYLVQQIQKKFGSTIYFSATLQPMHYFFEMLGGLPDDYTIKIPSPFAKEQVEVFVQPISTRYKDRDNTKDEISNLIFRAVQKRKGNYLVFFPSYQYMLSIYEDFKEKYPFLSTIIQSNGMTEEEREKFLLSFTEENEDILIGFAVLGGVFSEGVDLKGDRLNGVIVVGVGLPQLCVERNVMKDYFQATKRNGYDFAYTFPGINKVIQAGGRLIRSETDSGTIILIDDRFLTAKYQSLLPDEWRDFTVFQKMGMFPK